MSVWDQRLSDVQNRVAKWRSVLTGWQLGTRPDTDPECQAVRDHREATMMLRAEVSALTALLVASTDVSLDDYKRQLIVELEALDKMYEARFPGFKAMGYGMSIDPRIAVETQRGWKP